jgi:hypothetical protein
VVAGGPQPKDSSLSEAIKRAVLGIPIAALLGAVVILPRHAAFNRLSRLRAPAWLAVLPATIIVGTFGPLAVPPLARILVLLAAVVMPLLAMMAAVWAVRRLLLAAMVALAVAGGLIVHVAWLTQFGPSLVAALGCLTLGVAAERLIPPRWLLSGVVAMAVVDAAVIASGVGERETVLMGGTSGWLSGIRFTGVRLGYDSIGYPDLFLAGLLGAALAGDRRQLWAAGVVFALTFAFDSFLAPGSVLPATVPLAVTLLVTTAMRAAQSHRVRAAPV